MIPNKTKGITPYTCLIQWTFVKSTKITVWTVSTVKGFWSNLVWLPYLRPGEPEFNLPINPEWVNFLCTPTKKPVFFDVKITNNTKDRQCYKVLLVNHNIYVAFTTLPWQILNFQNVFEIEVLFYYRTLPFVKFSNWAMKPTFQVKCTSVDIFRVQPPMGAIKPNETINIRIWFQVSLLLAVLVIKLFTSRIYLGLIEILRSAMICSSIMW